MLPRKKNRFPIPRDPFGRFQQVGIALFRSQGKILMAVMDKRHDSTHMLFWSTLDGERVQSLISFLTDPDAEGAKFWIGGTTPSDLENFLATGELPLGSSSPTESESEP